MLVDKGKNILTCRFEKKHKIVHSKPGSFRKYIFDALLKINLRLRGLKVKGRCLVAKNGHQLNSSSFRVFPSPGKIIYFIGVKITKNF